MGNLQGWADVTLDLGDVGKVRIHDCSIVQVPDKPRFLGLPQKKGKSKWFPVVEFEGPLLKLVTSAVFAEWDKNA